MPVSRTFLNSELRQNPPTYLYHHVADTMRRRYLGDVSVRSHPSASNPGMDEITVTGEPDQLIDTFLQIVQDADKRMHDPKSPKNPYRRERQAVTKAVTVKRRALKQLKP